MPGSTRKTRQAGPDGCCRTAAAQRKKTRLFPLQIRPAAQARPVCPGQRENPGQGAGHPHAACIAGNIFASPPAQRHALHPFLRKRPDALPAFCAMRRGRICSEHGFSSAASSAVSLKSAGARCSRFFCNANCRCTATGRDPCGKRAIAARHGKGRCRAAALLPSPALQGEHSGQQPFLNRTRLRLAHFFRRPASTAAGTAGRASFPAEKVYLC